MNKKMQEIIKMSKSDCIKEIKVCKTELKDIRFKIAKDVLNTKKASFLKKKVSRLATHLTSLVKTAKKVNTK